MMMIIVGSQKFTKEVKTVGWLVEKEEDGCPEGVGHRESLSCPRP
jgi:hypothetical protein